MLRERPGSRRPSSNFPSSSTFRPRSLPAARRREGGRRQGTEGEEAEAGAAAGPGRSPRAAEGSGCGAAGGARPAPPSRGPGAPSGGPGGASRPLRPRPRPSSSAPSARLRGRTPGGSRAPRRGCRRAPVRPAAAAAGHTSLTAGSAAAARLCWRFRAPRAAGVWRLPGLRTAARRPLGTGSGASLQPAPAQRFRQMCQQRSQLTFSTACPHARSDFKNPS